MLTQDAVPSTTERVPRHTGQDVNQRIQRQIEANVAYFARQDPRLLDLRLQELDREWDIERVLETNAAAFSLIGVMLTRFVSRRWFVIPTAVAGFLLQHAVQGWCPPVELFRRLGVRTQREIDEERTALKLLRGDFRYTAGDGNLPAKTILDAVRA
jgi:hypothetical protein